MKGAPSSSTSSLISDIASAEGMEQQALLARAQLKVGNVVKFQGQKKARADYLAQLRRTPA